jgi:uncharacterized membrane protein YgcG
MKQPIEHGRSEREEDLLSFIVLVLVLHLVAVGLRDRPLVLIIVVTKEEGKAGVVALAHEEPPPHLLEQLLLFLLLLYRDQRSALSSLFLQQLVVCSSSRGGGGGRRGGGGAGSGGAQGSDTAKTLGGRKPDKSALFVPLSSAQHSVFRPSFGRENGRWTRGGRKGRREGDERCV